MANLDLWAVRLGPISRGSPCIFQVNARASPPPAYLSQRFHVPYRFHSEDPDMVCNSICYRVRGILQIKLALRKTNMESDQEPFKEDTNLQRAPLQVPCQFSGVQPFRSTLRSS